MDTLLRERKSKWISYRTTERINVLIGARKSNWADYKGTMRLNELVYWVSEGLCTQKVNGVDTEWQSLYTHADKKNTFLCQFNYIKCTWMLLLDKNGPRRVPMWPDWHPPLARMWVNLQEHRCGRRAGLCDLHVRYIRWYLTDLETEASGSRIFEKPAVW